LTNGNLIEYGYGFFIKNERGIHSIGHGGAIDGFRAIEMYYPGQDVFIVLLCNSDRDDFMQLFDNITGLVLGNSFQGSYKELKINERILTSYIGTYQNEKYQVKIKIYRANGRIYGDLSNGTGANMMFMALTETKFLLPDIKRIKTTGEFITENGKVTKLILTQEEPVEFIKIE
jgi:hypothetical protein